MKIPNPFNPDKDPLNHQIFERFLQELFRKMKTEDVIEIVSVQVLAKIEENLKKLDNPLIIEFQDLVSNFNELYKETQILLKNHDKTIDSIEKKSKKLFNSSSLAEDVFKLKDDIKSYEKKLDKLLRAMRHSLD